MNILVIGSGGREHAIINSISKSKKCSKIYALPGNGGTESLADNIEGDVNDFDLIKKITLEHKVSLVFVGPEDPIVNGIYDFFKSNNELKDVNIIAPSKQAGLLEGSKDFAKDFMEKYNIPTAKHKTFSIENINQADSFLESMNPPYVLKADGLAAGKGVLILRDIDEAKLELRNMILDKKFGDSSTKVVIEEFLDGIELSCFILTDGEKYKVLPFAKDYKKIGEGDTGLNTGGMGAISPVPFLDDKFLSKIQNKIIKRTITGIIKENMKYNGFIFIGLIKVDDEPYVIEYNVRMGDPETEVVLPRLNTDLVEIFLAIRDQTLNKIDLNINSKSATTVVLVSGGYPEAYAKGMEISGLKAVSDAIVFHAGAENSNGKVVTSGGRVMAVTALGEDYKSALATTYQAVSKINFTGMTYRTDLGFEL